MKVLILANNDLGLYNFRKELIERLILEHNEVYISLPNGKRIKDLEQMGCKYIDTNVDRRGTSIIKDLKLMMKYRKIVKDIKPDIILTYTIKPNIYGGIIARFQKVPYIENITGLGTALENRGILQKITILLYKVALKKANCCFVQNSENLNFMKNKVGYPEKYELIPRFGSELRKI